MNMPLLPIAVALAAFAQQSRTYEPVLLPLAVHGLQDHAGTEAKPRPVINVLLDGRILYEGRLLDDPASPAEERWAKLDEALGQIVADMPRAPRFEGGPEMPAGALLVRADMVAEFLPVQRIMERGAGLYLARYDLAVADAREPLVYDDEQQLVLSVAPARYLPLVLPGDLAHGHDEEPIEAVELKLTLKTPGRKLAATHARSEPWSAEAGTRYRWDMGRREVVYLMGPRKLTDFSEVQQRLNGLRQFLRKAPLVIEPEQGVTVGEVLRVLDTARGLGARDVRMVGAH
jgi:hypothetical protein